jgi:putative transcriptional regulator
LFNELVESVREGMAILRGESVPSRAFVAEDPDVTGIRTQCQLSRQEFANRIGVSVRTVREWEQGKRAPRGPARVLLEVAAKHPEAVRDVLQSRVRIEQIVPEPRSKVA